MNQWYDELLAKVEQDPSRYPHFRLRLRGKQLFKSIFVNKEVWVRLIPCELREVLEESHDDPVAGHLGVKKNDRTYSQVIFVADYEARRTRIRVELRDLFGVQASAV